MRFDALLRMFRPGEGRARERVAAVPEGLRLYVVGDVHGRADLLRALHQQILGDASAAADAPRRRLVYLGDYVDRGHESRAVIDLLLDEPLEGFERVFLKGNHEDLMLGFLDDPAVGGDWFAIGGQATLLSYGVTVPPGVATPERLEEIRDGLRAALPDAHLAFLTALELSHQVGDYFFVHGGIVPGRPLARQHPADMLWTRDEFLASDRMHEKVIVHGHTVSDEPEVRPNRIGIDTGAYYSNRLTCLVLEGTSRRFLQTG